MALKDTRQKFGNAVGAFADLAKEKSGQAVEVARAKGDQAVHTARDTVRHVAEKAQEDQRQRHLRKYGPIMREEFFAGDFDIPYTIIIEDEDARKGIDVCEGSIGWLAKEGLTEILHLYHEAIDDTGLSFTPSCNIGDAFYIDPHVKGKYINLSGFFETTQKEKVTELRNVAFMLGAKHCRIESHEEESNSSEASKKVSATLKGIANGVKASASASSESKCAQTSGKAFTVLFEQTFEGDSEPQVPELVWFKNDTEIQSLIDMRCNNTGRTVKTYTIGLKGSSYGSMSQNTAKTLDSALGKIGGSGSKKLSSKVESECQQTLVLHIEF